MSNPYLAPDSYEPGSADIDWMTFLFSFDGRVNRGQFWAGTIGYGMLGMLIAFPIMLITPEDYLFVALIVLIPVIIAYAWASLALRVKRWHDLDYTGFMIFIGLIPYLGGLIELVMTGFLPGTSGPNTYGDQP